MGAIPLGLVVSIVGAVVDRPNRIAVAGIGVSVLTGLMVLGLAVITGFCR